MPAIRGTYFEHPVTGEPGAWVDLVDGGLVDGGLVGLPASEFPPIDPAWTQEELNLRATTFTQNLLGPSVVVLIEVATRSPVTFARFEIHDPEMDDA